MKWLIFALQLVPHVLQAVTEVEASVKAPGATKKAIIMGAITSAAHVGEAVPDQTTQLVSSLIDGQVKELNDSGIFTKAASSVVTAAA